MAWIPFPRTRDINQLDFFVGNLPEYVLKSDVLVVGLHPTTARKLGTIDFVLNVVERRIEGRPLLLVYHDDRGVPIIEQSRGQYTSGLSSHNTLECIAKHDVEEVLRRPGSTLEQHAGFHYEGPNGDHYGAFLRTGFAVRSIDELDRLAFWLAPQLQGRKCLLVDHSSMIAIGYHIGRYLSELGSSGQIVVESLRTYDEGYDDLVNRLRGAFGQVAPDDGVILVSVNSSGRLVQSRLLPAMQEIGFPNPLEIALARTPGVQKYSIKSLTTLNDQFQRHSANDCLLCKTNNTTVLPITRDSYLLDLTAYVRPTAITRKNAKGSTQVIERYKGVGAFSVHKTHTDGRHFAFFVNIVPILNHESFTKRLRSELKKWSDIEIDLILYPPSNTSRILAEMVAKYLGVENVLECEESRVPSLDGDRKKMAIRAKRICVVDDVVNTGSRVFGYRRAIAALRSESGADDYEIYCLAGIVRTCSDNELGGLKDVFHHTSADPRFLMVERLCLPAWDAEECPWCKEQQLLSELSDETKGLP